jgi:predicted XRE-type DNA-binding protein
MMNDNQKQKGSLTFDEAVQTWLMHWEGLIQSAIAHHFKVNQGRVNEVLKEVKHNGSKSAAMIAKGNAA